ncbi:hypothetical protein SDC9_154770 [bioreactor metagenome]|uniref:Uncharacterized protein n=1 Tax=bioreactor metagenome TaxID=1076179 RepID=A0A645F168_9ZZZZ
MNLIIVTVLFFCAFIVVIVVQRGNGHIKNQHGEKHDNRIERIELLCAVENIE